MTETREPYIIEASTITLDDLRRFIASLGSLATAAKGAIRDGEEARVLSAFLGREVTTESVSYLQWRSDVHKTFNDATKALARCHELLNELADKAGVLSE